MNVSRFDPFAHSLEFNVAHGSQRFTAAERAPETALNESEARLDASASAVARELAIYEAALRVNHGAMPVLDPIL